MNRFGMDGQVAIVTGASRGIGAATSMGFAEAGAKLVLGARNQHDLSDVADRIRAAGSEAVVVDSVGYVAYWRSTDCTTVGGLPGLVEVLGYDGCRVYCEDTLVGSSSCVQP